MPETVHDAVDPVFAGALGAAELAKRKPFWDMSIIRPLMCGAASGTKRRPAAEPHESRQQLVPNAYIRNTENATLNLLPHGKLTACTPYDFNMSSKDGSEPVKSPNQANNEQQKPKDHSNARTSATADRAERPATPTNTGIVLPFAIDNTPGLAPLWQEKEPVPGEYLITFKPGYTLAQHYALIGPEIEAKKYGASGCDRCYRVTDMLDKELLVAFRRDVHVDHVTEGGPPSDYDYIDFETDYICTSPGALERSAANKAALRDAGLVVLIALKRRSRRR